MAAERYAVEIQDYSGRKPLVTYLSGTPHASSVGFVRKYRQAALFDGQEANEAADFVKELLGGQKGIYVVVVLGGSYDAFEDCKFNALARAQSA